MCVFGLPFLYKGIFSFISLLITICEHGRVFIMRISFMLIVSVDEKTGKKTTAAEAKCVSSGETGQSITTHWYTKFTKVS